MIEIFNALANVGTVILICICILCLVGFGIILSLIMRITHLIREEDTAMQRRLRDDK